jgi:hypothetical protein
MGPTIANPVSMAYQALIPVNVKQTEIVGKIRTEQWLQRTPLGSPGDDIRI